MTAVKASEIDALLPQTQCGLCGYGGCLPYADALADNKATIDLCPPGGIETLKALGELLQIDPAPYIDAMLVKAKPRNIAIIREDECIGCTKCIIACPFDAIVGTGKQMHTVITDECTGCELCVPPCPVDCIDIARHPQQLSALTENENVQLANQFRNRFNARNNRMTKQQQQKEHAEAQASLTSLRTPAVDDKLAYIKAAILRAKTKKACHK